MARNAQHLWTRHKARELSRTATYKEPSEEAKRARESLAYFGEFVADKPAMPHHQIWIDALVTGKDSSQLKKVAGNNTAILAPRGSAKSSWLGFFVAWTIGHNPDIQIIYCSYSESVALSRSRLIQRLIQSDRYRQVFPEILPGKRFSATDWEISKEFANVTSLDADYTFLAVGATGSITSKRSKLILVDDAVKSSESIDNPDVREKLETNWNEVLRPTLIPGGRVITIGTRFRADDLFATTFTREKGWHVIEQSAILEDPDTGEEVSYWQDRYPIEELQQLRESSGASFSFQFQNKIVRISDISLDPNWIKREPVPDDITKYDALVVGLDLSATERERADYTAFVLAGRIDNKFYILDARQGRWGGNISKLQTLLSICLDWEILVQDDRGNYTSPYGIPLYLHSEEVQYQASLASDFKHFMQNEHRIYNVIYRGVKAKGSKLSRLRGVSGLFQSGLVTFNSYRAMGQLIDQLCNFGSMDKDDLVDSCVYALMGLTKLPRLDVA